MNDGCKDAISTQREPKHVVMQGSINRLDSVLDKLDSLVDEVRGTEPEKGCDKLACEQSVKSLGNFLADGNVDIANMSDRLGKGIEDLRKLLF